MSVLNENTLIGASAAGGYDIPNSLRFNDDDSAYLSRTPSSAGNRKTWTWSGWVKRGSVATSENPLLAATTDANNRLFFRFELNNLRVYWNVAGVANEVITTAVFRDASAWYHVVLAMDTTQVTDTDRINIYVNGIQQTLTGTYIPQNTDTQINLTVAQLIGKKDTAATYLDGYLSEVNFIDGQALTPDDFGETGDYGEWLPKKYIGTYGTNGFYLDFKDSGSLGNDAAGSNNWTPTNLAATDQMLDSPTNNFATWNPLLKTLNADYFQEGNLLGGSTSNWVTILSTIAASTGKWYWETSEFTGTNVFNGAIVSSVNTQQYYAPNESGSIGYKANGMLSVDGSTTLNWAATYGTTDIIGVALDLDSATRTVKFYKNNTLQGTVNLTSNFTGSTVPWITTHSSSAIANFGQDSSFAGNKTPQGNQDANGIGDFYYAPPDSFLALCTKSLPDATVVPSEHFNTVLYTGNGSSTHAITAVGFTPDWLWAKQRNTTRSHRLLDSVRGNGVYLASDNTNSDASASGLFKTFDSDGFTLDAASALNQSGGTYVAWNWKAGGTGVSNTDGTITSTVSANVDAGFSIVSYAGTGANATVGHGLSVAPELVIAKNRTLAKSWTVYSAETGANKYLRLDATNAEATDTNMWQNTNPSTSVFSLGTDSWNNGSTNDYIAYAFHSVDGYSKVGSYTGNGSADGTFVYTGFRPAYVMIKCTDAAESWYVWDDARSTYNLVADILNPNVSNAENVNTDRSIDMLSNGFKLKGTNAATNGSGNSYIYLCFAESPFKHSNAR